MVKPVVGLDIDGTLGDYHDHWLRFAEQYLGKPLPRGYDGSVSLAQWCGISKATYRKIKLAYRQGGMKRSMPVFPYARELTVGLRRARAEVVICTTRPYLHLSNIEPDTMHWLRRNGIQFDNVIIGEHKYNQLKREYGLDRIVMVIDDEPEQVEKASRLGLPAVLRRAKHNSNFLWMNEINNLEFAEHLGLRYIADWKASHATT
jgi:5'(3')-deoxyribonucleotidase